MGIIRHDPRRIASVTATSAMAAENVAGGKVVPIVMVDTAGRPELSELLRMHQFTSAGDCFSQWGTPVGNSDSVLLSLDFERPIATSVILSFALPKFAMAVDAAMRAKAVYLQHGTPGDSYSTTADAERILIEVAATGFESLWERIFQKTVERDLRTRGMSRAESRKSRAGAIRAMRSTFDIRL